VRATELLTTMRHASRQGHDSTGKPLRRGRGVRGRQPGDDMRVGRDSEKGERGKWKTELS
jgi:hypothetical protein